jgi:hypothetical protein
MSANFTFYPKYFDHFKSLPAAMFLSKLHFWYLPGANGKSKLRVLRDNFLWIAKTAEEWQQECCISVRAVRDAIALLESSGVIERKSMRFRGIKMLHIRATRITGDGCLQNLENLIEHLPPISEKSGTPSGSPNGHHSEPICTPSKDGFVQDAHPGLYAAYKCDTGSTQQNLGTKEKNLALPKKQATEPSSQSPKITPETEDKVKFGNTAAQILAHYKHTNSGEAGDAPKSPAQKMIAIWRDVVPKHCSTVKMVGAFTVKDQGQLARLYKAWLPNSEELLTFILSEWVEFIKYCESTAGAFKSPIAPAIGYLVKYKSEAMNYWLLNSAGAMKKVQGSLPPAEEELSSPSSSQVPLQAVPVVVPPAKEVPATLEEILSWKKNL